MDLDIPRVCCSSGGAPPNPVSVRVALQMEFDSNTLSSSNIYRRPTNREPSILPCCVVDMATECMAPTYSNNESTQCSPHDNQCWWKYGCSEKPELLQTASSWSNGENDPFCFTQHQCPMLTERWCCDRDDCTTCDQAEVHASNKQPSALFSMHDKPPHGVPNNESIFSTQPKGENIDSETPYFYPDRELLNTLEFTRTKNAFGSSTYSTSQNSSIHQWFQTNSTSQPIKPSGTRKKRVNVTYAFEFNRQPNTCIFCTRVYARPSTLKTHLRTHAGLRPHRCSFCDKWFSQTANLAAHLRTHSGERPFQCPICQKRFSQSSSVTTHLRTHSGERPYACTFCPKAFADSSTLTKHIRIHSGEKPYRCNQCSMSFSQSGNLKRHVRIHARQVCAGFPDGGHSVR